LQPLHPPSPAWTGAMEMKARLVRMRRSLFIRR
jgi:hypothetical protein